MRKYNKKPNIFMMLLGREKGFSLVEIMVAAGMLGVVSLGVMQMTKNMNRSTKKMKQDFEAETQIRRIQNELNNVSSCTQTFNNITLAGAATPVSIAGTGLRDENGVTFADQATEFGRGAPGQAGSGGVIHIQDITIQGFTNAPNNVDARVPPLGAPGGAKALVAGLNRGSAQVRIIFQKGFWADNLVFGAPTAQRIEALRGASLGSLTFARTFQIEVLAAGNTIHSCYGNEDQYVEAACGMMSGALEAGNCKNITVSNNSALAPPTTAGAAPGAEDYAISALGNVTIKALATDDYGVAPGDNDAGSFSVGVLPNTGEVSNLDVFGSVGIGAAGVNAPISNTALGAAGSRGGFLDVYRGGAIWGTDGFGFSVGHNDPPAGTGNLLVTNSLSVTSNTGTPNLGATGTAYFSNSLGVGVAAPAGGDNAGDIVATDDVVARGALVVGTTAGISETSNSAVGSAAIGRSLVVGSGTAPPSDNGDAHFTANVGIGTAPPATPATGGLQVNTGVGVGTLPSTYANGGIRVGTSETIIIGENAADTQSANAIVIPGMARYDQELSGGTLPASVQTEVPNKRWVETAIAHVLSNEADMTSILTSLNTYIASNPLDGVKSNVCSSLDVTINGSTMTSSWDGNQCNIDGTLTTCGTVSSDRCSTFYTINLDATGTVNVNNNAYIYNNGNITTSGNVTLSSGYITASSYGQFGSYVQGSRFCLSGSTAATNCITRVRMGCGAGQYVIGWYNGWIQCQTLTINQI